MESLKKKIDAWQALAIVLIVIVIAIFGVWLRKVYVAQQDQELSNVLGIPIPRVGTPTTDDSYPYANLAESSPWQLPITNDEGQKAIYASFRRFDVQCRALVKYTGKQCACAYEAVTCISAMGSMPDILNPPGLSPFDK